MNSINKHSKIVIKNKIFVFFFLLCLSIFSTCQLLGLKNIPRSPNEDLARHLACVANFNKAILSGQYIPRLQTFDSTNLPTVIPNDVPVFQYYGFLSSCFAQPFYFAKFSLLNSLVLGIVLLRFLGCLALYFSLKMVFNLSKICIFGPILWLSVPYINTNLYSRVAFPESAGQAVITFIPLAICLLNRGKAIKSLLMVIIAVVFLALSHPIIFLWGIVSFLLLEMFFIINGEFKKAGILAFSICTGLFLASFQFLPAYLSSNQLALNFFQGSPAAASHLSSLSGFYGYLVPLVEKYSNGVTANYFFTVSVGTLPSILFALFRIQKNKIKNTITQFTLLSSLFLFLAFTRYDVWKFFPKIFWATQFPYRLISFVAVFSVFPSVYLLSIINKKSHILMLVAVFINLIPSYKSFISSLNPNNLISNFSQISTEYASSDYIISKKGIAAGDGWMIEDNLLEVPTNERKLIINLCSRLPDNIDNIVFVIDKKTGQCIREIHVSSEFSLHEIKIPTGIQKIQLVPEKTFKPSLISKSSDSRNLSIVISEISFSQDDYNLVPKIKIQKKISGPYSRNFAIDISNCKNINKIAVLPLAYSPFFQVKQGNREIKCEPTFDGYTEIKFTDDKYNLVNVVYKYPSSVYFLTLLGCFFTFLACILKNKLYPFREV